MTITVTVSGEKRVSVILARISLKIKGGAKSLSEGAVANICGIVIAWDVRHFQLMQNDRFANKISLPQAVFTRKRDFVNNTSITAIMASVSRMLPLNDTGRLFKSISVYKGSDMRVEVTQGKIAMVNLVPYMGKHISGISILNRSLYEMFEFGETERKNLLKRVPPPPLKGHGPQVGRPKGSKNRRDSKRGVVRGLRIGDEGEEGFVHEALEGYPDVKSAIKKVNITGRDKDEKGDLKSSRPYYRLRGWAEKRYPTIAALKKRNWLVPVSNEPLIVELISKVIRLDIVEDVK